MGRGATRIIYNLNPDNCVYNLIYEYAKDALKPILFAHYNHESVIHEPYTTAVKDQDWCSLFVSLSGNFSFILGDKIYSPAYGDVVFMREHERYSSCFHSSGRMDYYEINFPPEFFEKAAGIEEFRKIFYQRNDAERNLISFNKIESAAVLDKLKMIENTPAEKGLIRYSYILQFLDIMCGGFYERSHEFTHERIPPKLKEAILFMHSEFLTIGGICDVTKACGISGVYLARIFKKYLFCTPNDYLTNLRISYAKQMLASGASITDACYESGFNNYSYFIAKFRRSVGVTPLKFKKDMI